MRHGIGSKSTESGTPQYRNGTSSLAPDALDQIALVDQVVAAQRQQVGAVHAIGRRGQPEQELRREVVDDPAVRRSRRVVELVDDDVVEVVGGERREPAGKRLDAGEDESRVGRFSPP